MLSSIDVVEHQTIVDASLSGSVSVWNDNGQEGQAGIESVILPRRDPC